MFIKRENGEIVGTYRRPQYPGQEKLPDDHPEVLAFLDKHNNPPPRSRADKITAVDDIAAGNDFHSALIETIAELTGNQPAQVIATIKSKIV